jgi:hypothetical protein
MVEETRQQQQANTPEAGSSLLFKVFVASFVPFMGFGFVDNFMMVRACARLGTGELSAPVRTAVVVTLRPQPSTRLGLTLRRSSVRIRQSSVRPDF